MEAILKRVLIKPASYYETGDKEGELKIEEYAAINLNIPMDTAEQEKAVVDLFNLLRNRRVHISIVTEQPELPFGDATVKVVSKELSRNDAKQVSQVLGNVVNQLSG
jgi:hypothetical protein